MSSETAKRPLEGEIPSPDAKKPKTGQPVENQEKFEGNNADCRGSAEDIKFYYNSGEADNWYTKVWGPGIIHFGYFTELEGLDDEEAKKCNVTTEYEKAAEVISTRLADKAKLNKDSIVLDLGCGYGKPAIDVARHAKCKVTGLDLSELHIEKATEFAKKKENADIDVKFVHGDMTKLPDAVKTDKPNTIFTQAAFCHVHHLLDAVFKEAANILPEGGLLLINDCLSPKKASPLTEKYVYQRMSFKSLVTVEEYRKAIEDNGFEIESLELLTWHFYHSYRILAERSERINMKELAFKYRKTCEAIELGEYDMIEIVARKKKAA